MPRKRMDYIDKYNLYLKILNIFNGMNSIPKEFQTPEFKVYYEQVCTDKKKLEKYFGITKNW